MNHDTFRDDGYIDATAGNPPNPPDARTRYDGITTNAYALEYMQGYKQGLYEKKATSEA
jgi:hypothetical protein